MKIKNDLSSMGKFKVVDRSQTHFWEMLSWITPLSELIHISLYNIVGKKSVIMAMVLRLNLLNVTFMRSLVGNNLQAWHQLAAKIVDVPLTDHRDSFLWSLK